MGLHCERHEGAEVTPGRKELRLVELQIRNLKEITPAEFDLWWVWTPPAQLEQQQPTKPKS